MTLSSKTSPAEMTTEEKTALLAEFVGKPVIRMTDSDFLTGEIRVWFNDDKMMVWRPYEDWNHAHMVLEKVMKNIRLWEAVIDRITVHAIRHCYQTEVKSFMGSDLPTKMDAVCSCILDSSHSEK